VLSLARARLTVKRHRGEWNSVIGVVGFQRYIGSVVTGALGNRVEGSAYAGLTGSGWHVDHSVKPRELRSRVRFF